MTAQERLKKVAQEISECQECDLAYGRTHTVPGEGPADARLMFVGEGPGFHEDRQGRPFVGAAGKLLEELLGSIGLSREEVFIANVIKCRPPGNRDPSQEELKACKPYLDRQIEIIRPRVDGPLLLWHHHLSHPRTGETVRGHVGHPCVPSGGGAPSATLPPGAGGRLSEDRGTAGESRGTCR